MSALISAGASWKQISGESYQNKQMAWKLGLRTGGFWLPRAVPDGEQGPASRLEGASGQGGPARRVGKGAGGLAGPGPTTETGLPPPREVLDLTLELGWTAGARTLGRYAGCVGEGVPG